MCLDLEDEDEDLSFPDDDDDEVVLAFSPLPPLVDDEEEPFAPELPVVDTRLGDALRWAFGSGDTFNDVDEDELVLVMGVPNKLANSLAGCSLDLCFPELIVAADEELLLAMSPLLLELMARARSRLFSSKLFTMDVL